MFKIYTRRGDTGTAGLSIGKRQKKDAPVFHTLGSLDESQAYIGELVTLSTAAKLSPEILDILQQAQQILFGFGAHFSLSKGWEAGGVTASDVLTVEKTIDVLETKLPPLRNFILASGPAVVTRYHLTRAVVRRLERDVVALSRKQLVAKEVLTYLNRFSDFLFVAARSAAMSTKTPELIWRGNGSSEPSGKRVKKS